MSRFRHSYVGFEDGRCIAIVPTDDGLIHVCQSYDISSAAAAITGIVTQGRFSAVETC
jgi:hypothetical protein